jgi:hypothetical protein
MVAMTPPPPHTHTLSLLLPSPRPHGSENSRRCFCLPPPAPRGRRLVCRAVMSKRKLNKLVTEAHVNGWDDPRMLTLAGLRRRGYTPEVRCTAGPAGGGGSGGGANAQVGGRAGQRGTAPRAVSSPLVHQAAPAGHRAERPLPSPHCTPPPHDLPPSAGHQQLLPRGRHHAQRQRGGLPQAGAPRTHPPGRHLATQPGGAAAAAGRDHQLVRGWWVGHAGGGGLSPLGMGCRWRSPAGGRVGFGRGGGGEGVTD